MHESRILRERVAGQSAMSEVVRAQAEAPQRSVIARILGFSPLTGTSRASYRGALGELFVGDVLENLGQRWDVLHDLPLGESVLDHLLIGPAGVFAVRAANYSGEDVTIDGTQLVVAGTACDDIRSAASDADAASRLLSAAAGSPVRVRPLLVLLDPKRLTVKVPAPGVRIIAASDLERVITKAPRTLSGDEVARISDLADLVTTWPAAEGTVQDTQQLHRQFAVIRDQVRRAVVRRVAWVVVGLGLSYTLLWMMVLMLVSLALT